MKKTATVLMIGIILMATGCTKDAVTISGSQWSIDGVTYIGNTTVYGASFLESNNNVSDSLINSILINFKTKPVTDGKYGVILQTSTPTSTQCAITTLKIEDGSTVVAGPVSSGTATDSVTVTIIDGKIHASFSSVAMIENNLFYTAISGTLIEQ
jgi:hypothetical protein